MSLHRFVAGTVAGLSVLALDDSSRRRTFALYLLARVAQVCIYFGNFLNAIKFLLPVFEMKLCCFWKCCAYLS